MMVLTRMMITMRTMMTVAMTMRRDKGKDKDKRIGGSSEQLATIGLGTSLGPCERYVCEGHAIPHGLPATSPQGPTALSALVT